MMRMTLSTRLNVRRQSLSAFDGLNDCLQGVQETRAVAFGKGRRPAGNLPRFTQMCRQIAHRHGLWLHVDAAMAGALLGIGRYKGFGLSLMTDVMTGVLAGGGFGLAPYSDPARQDVSHSFLALDIAWFMPLAEFNARMDRFIDEVKGGRLRPGFTEILVPGELEHRRAEDKRANGVPLDSAVFADLNDLAAALGIDARLTEMADAA